ncbi:MAG: DUF1073 domain-containing protein, partial [Proteobacteria bacterium]|nr:DUF1073 domain-containing protein [Pseudomonadota bacterium]
MNNSFGRAGAKMKAAQSVSMTATDRRTPYRPHELSNAYTMSPIVRQVCDAPVYGALGKWRIWGGDETQNKAIELAERELGVQAVLIEAYKRARKDGGCAILIGTAEEDYSIPLEPRTLDKGGIEYLSVLPRSLFNRVDINAQPGTEGYREATMFHLSLVTSRAGGQENRSTDRIHPSRLVVFRGAPRYTHTAEISMDDYWGDSVLQAFLPSIISLESTRGNTAFMTFEARTPVLSIGVAATETTEASGALSSSVESQDAKNDVAQMLQNMADFKGITGMSVIDKETMEYKVHNYNFSGLPDVIAKFEEAVSGETDIPVTILFSRVPTGLSATTSSATADWHQRLEDDQRNIIQPTIQRLDELLTRHALGRTVSEDLTYEWRPLAEQSELDKVMVFNIEAERVAKLIEAGLIQPVPGQAIID